MPPFIKRIQVEEGFLAGLDLYLTPGLNVIIGPRGVGKTSIVELLRLCLGVQGISSDFDERSREHAQSVLGPDGRITVTISDGAADTTVSRGVTDQSPRQSTPFTPPRIFSQAEIERVGLEAKGRLRIIDEFGTTDAGNTRAEDSFEARTRSATIQIAQLTQSIEAVKEHIASLAHVGAELEKATRVQASVLQTVKQSRAQQERLAVLNTAVAAAAVRTKQIDHALREIESWQAEVADALRRAPHLSKWPESAGPQDILAPAREGVRRVTAVVEQAIADIRQLLVQTQAIRQHSQSGALKLEEEARALRKTLEHLKAGAGTAAQKVAALQERASELEALKSREKELHTRVNDAIAQRRTVLEQLQRLRDDRYRFRSTIAGTLTKELGPTIAIDVEQGGDSPGYVGAIQAAIRGSGLHYSTLAPQLADAMSPTELVEAVERGDAAALARLSGISEERAVKAIEAVRRSGAEAIITAPIHDRVTMRLLDGHEYKPTTELSTGQRCTVVLSVLLASGERGLVIDQPEDHLDNAFIVKTLIESIRRRKSETQLIFTTHNANIPVLADADLVVLLGSDGQRGYVRHAGPLSDLEVVRSITTVMEGGYEAFELRARFYRTSLGTQ